MPNPYYIIQDERGRWVFSTHEADANLGGSYRSPSEAYDVLCRHLRSEGVTVGKLQPYGQGFRVESLPAHDVAVAAPTMLYSAQAIKLIEDMKETFGKILKQSALDLARSHGRTLVTTEDIWAVVEKLDIPLFDEGA